MSDDTHTALEAAIQAHIADVQDGEVLMDWVLITSSKDWSDAGYANSSYHLEAPTTQSVHVTLGLLRVADQRYMDAFEDADE